MGWKEGFVKFSPFLAKIAFCIKSTHGIKLFLETIFSSIVGWNKRFVKFSPFLTKKCVFHQIYSWNTNLFWKLCFHPLSVESRILQNLHHFLVKNAFCIKSTHGIKLFLENCVFRHGAMKTAFRQIFTNSRWKMGFALNPVSILRHGELITAFRHIFTNSCWNTGFALNPLMEYNSFLKTVFCAMVSWKQRFATFLSILAEIWVLHQIYSWNTTLSWKLCFALLWVENSVFQNFQNFSPKMRFPWYPLMD